MDCFANNKDNSSEELSSSDETCTIIGINKDVIKKNKSNEIKRTRSTFPFGKCKVCNDKATGVHYGVPTCEGCKVCYNLQLEYQFY